MVSYQKCTALSTKTPPGQIQLIIPASSNLITINHSTGLLKTKGVYVDGNITNATSITSTTFVGALSGNASTVTNGVYLNNTWTQSIAGNIVLDSVCITTNTGTAETLAQNLGDGNNTLAFGMGNAVSIQNSVYMFSRNMSDQAIYGALALTNFGSDDRRKHNEIPITNALEAIMKLQCETYDKTFVLKNNNWHGKLENEANWKESGLNAQDMYEIDEFKPYVVVGDDTTSWDINYNNIYCYNIKATQELKLENDQLRKSTVDLVNKVYELELKFDMVMKQLKL